MSKLRGGRLLNEVEKCRIDGNWRRVLDLVTSNSLGKGSGLESSCNFFFGEAYLELYVEEHKDILVGPPERHEQPLYKAKKHLLAVFDSSDVKQEVALEANLLLSKLYFFCGKYDDALTGFTKAKLDQLDVEYKDLRALRLVAEAYAVKGFCLEIMQPRKFSSKHQKTPRMEKITNAYMKSTELALSYLQECEKAISPRQLSLTSPLPAASSNAAGPCFSSVPKMGILLEALLRQVPLSFVRNGHLDQAVDLYRRILPIVDSTIGRRVQQILCCQLAELLCRAVTDTRYKLPKISQADTIASSLLTVSSVPFGDMVNQPAAKPAIFAPANRINIVLRLQRVSEVGRVFSLPSPALPCTFCDAHVRLLLDNSACAPLPTKIFEEMYVLACISEAIAEHDMTFNDPDEKQEMMVTLRPLHNLVTHLLAYLRQFRLLTDVLCTAVNYSQEDSHLWLQYALSFVCDQQDGMAASAFRVLFSLLPENSPSASDYLFAARLYLEKFEACDIAIKLAEHAFNSSGNAHVKSRSKVLIGLALSRMADFLPLTAGRNVNGRSPLKVLHEAVELDINDYLAEFYLALEYALSRDLQKAEEHCRRSWQLCPDQPNTTFLLALLLTAKKLPEEALELVEEAISEHPSHSALLLLRLRLYSKLFQHEYVITAAKELLVMWRTTGRFLSTLGSPIDTAEWRNPTKTGSTSERHSHSVPSQKGAPSSNERTSVVATNVEYADTDSLVFSNIGGMASHHSSSEMSLHFSELNCCAVTVEARLRGESSIWLELAETLLELGMTEEVAKCIDEAVKVSSQAAHIIYLKARLYHLNGCLKEAATCYEVALSACPHYASSARYLALIRQSQGNFKLAEKLLRDVVRMEPMNSYNWILLGELLTAKGADSEAADCFSTSMALVDISPLLPFSIIPRVMSLS
ncbi:hypothetical protein M513_04564 [Trichuris suis]|uniref:Tetratricopeptide repeat protein 7 N-terminal domain-containing protein n=1 Tax=Trichuris suis TaxID=68888 RepID=A0A085MBM3_9BILA|nr:hypothetical protein M513_04564 [Trichuris suis]